MAQLWSDKQLNIKSYWFYILDFSLCIIVLVAHMTILILLYRRKHFSRRKNELYILISLCHTESMFAVETIFYVMTGFITIDHILFVEFLVWFTRFTGFYLSILYYFFMLLLTVDRFLLFYLNLKYRVLCTPRRVLKCIYAIVLTSALFTLVLIASSKLKEQTFQQSTLKLMVCFCIFLDSAYIVIVFITYGYIFALYRRCMKTRKTSHSRKESNDQFRLAVPTFIIASFVLFSILPNFIIFFVTLDFLEAKVTTIRTIILMYRFGLLTDPLIYIFSTSSLSCKWKIYKV